MIPLILLSALLAPFAEAASSAPGTTFVVGECPRWADCAACDGLVIVSVNDPGACRGRDGVRPGASGQAGCDGITVTVASHGACRGGDGADGAAGRDGGDGGIGCRGGPHVNVAGRDVCNGGDGGDGWLA